MDHKKIKEYLSGDWDAFKETFTSNLKSDIPLLDKVNDYLFSRSGKQIRPMLCLLSARACAGSCNTNSILCAAATEMLHTATLLHDDVADNSATRRGVPTVMSLFSSSSSVLIGDYWMSKAISTIIDDCDQRILKSFSECIEDLAKGEMFQLQKADSMDTTEDDYIYIISHKTASLFRSAIKSGAYSSDADYAKVDALDSYAYHFGLSFQIRDDIFDYSPLIETGKPAGMDILEKKITLPLLGAFKNASPFQVKEIKNRIREIGHDRVSNSIIVVDILRFVEEYGGLEYAQNVLEEEAIKAVKSLAVLPKSQAKQFLSELAFYLGQRKV